MRDGTAGLSNPVFTRRAALNLSYHAFPNKATAEKAFCGRLASDINKKQGKRADHKEKTYHQSLGDTFF